MATPQTQQRRSFCNHLIQLIRGGDCESDDDIRKKRNDEEEEEETVVADSRNQTAEDDVVVATASDKEAREELEELFKSIMIRTTRPPSTDMSQRIESLAVSNPAIFAERYQLSAKKNELPAHIVAFVWFAHRTLPSSTLLATIDAYPEVMRIPSNGGDLLIHWVCRKFRRRSDSCEILEYLVEHCPDSALEESFPYELPLHGLLATRGLCIPKVVVTIVRLRPTFASTLHQSGNVPLQLILRYRTPTERKGWKEAIEALLEAYPEAVDDLRLLRNAWIVDHPWELRVCIVAHHLARRRSPIVGDDANTVMLPLSYTKHFPLHAIFYLHDMRYLHYDVLLIPTNGAIDQYKDRIRHVDTYGRLPLHIALLMGKGMVMKDLRRLVDLEPRAALVRDPITGLYPFMTVATMNFTANDGTNKETEQVDLIYRMFMVECCQDASSH